MLCGLPESHILEDVNKCIIALRDQDADNLDRAAGAIRGRAARVAHIVTGEMDSYEPGAYTEGVMKNVNFLTSTDYLTYGLLLGKLSIANDSANGSSGPYSGVMEI
ncbi:hypothetical protein STEG23_034398 [Scotinomys teguina]